MTGNSDGVRSNHLVEDMRNERTALNQKKAGADAQNQGYDGQGSPAKEPRAMLYLPLKQQAKDRMTIDA
eukprot:51029-Eustigmatos_ZCMA.PRE.1